MSSGDISVNPSPYTRTVKVVQIVNVSVVPFTSASISVSLKDESGMTVSNNQVFMDKDTYLQWNNDDNFLISYCLKELGLTPSS